MSPTPKPHPKCVISPLPRLIYASNNRYIRCFWDWLTWRQRKCSCCLLQNLHVNLGAHSDDLKAPETLETPKDRSGCLVWAGGQEIYTKTMAQGGRIFGREMWWSRGDPGGDGVMAAENVHRRRTRKIVALGFQASPISIDSSLECINLFGSVSFHVGCSPNTV